MAHVTSEGENRPKSTPTTPGEGIYCPLATNGLLFDDVGVAGFSALPALLTLEETTTRSKSYLPVYHTDEIGMKKALNIAYNAQGTVSSMLRTVGLLAANIQKDDLAEADAAGVGWLICALSELSEIIDGAAHGIGTAIADGRYLGGSGEAAGNG